MSIGAPSQSFSPNASRLCAMFGLSPKDAWLAALLVLSGAAFVAAARWSRQLEDGRPFMVCSVGFSLAFTLLALAAGVALYR